jgi:prolipoprotein diacylglyceryltransferase
MTDLPPQSVFFGVALLLSLATVAVASRRRGVDAATGLALFSASVVAAIVGARLLWCVAAPEAGLAVVLRQPALVWHPLEGGFASLGAMAGAAAVAWLSTSEWSWTRRWAMADAFVPSGLVGLGVARLGCLSNGCDFGAAVGWGIRYAPGTPAYQWHVEQGLVEAGAVESAATFPLPIIMAGACAFLAVAGIVAMPTARYGRTAVFAACGYFCVRMLAETFRSPATVETIWGPLNVNHLLALVGLLGTVVLWRAFGGADAAAADEPTE